MFLSELGRVKNQKLRSCFLLFSPQISHLVILSYLFIIIFNLCTETHFIGCGGGVCSSFKLAVVDLDEGRAPTLSGIQRERGVRF